MRDGLPLEASLCKQRPMARSAITVVTVLPAGIVERDMSRKKQKDGELLADRIKPKRHAGLPAQLGGSTACAVSVEGRSAVSPPQPGLTNSWAAPPKFLSLSSSPPHPPLLSPLPHTHPFPSGSSSGPEEDDRGDCLCPRYPCASDLSVTCRFCVGEDLSATPLLSVCRLSTFFPPSLSPSPPGNDVLAAPRRPFSRSRPSFRSDSRP